MKKHQAIIYQALRLTLFSLKARYRNTFAGFLWVILNPIIVFGAQSLAFKFILKIDIPNYSLFLLSNLLPWIFIMSNIQMCTSIFEVKSQVLKSFKLSPVIFVASQVIDNFINFTFSFIILFIYVSTLENISLRGFYLLPIAAVILIAGSFFLSAICATIQIFYRDLKFIVTFVTNIVFFITPIFYPVSYIPTKYQWILDFNIFYTLMRPFNAILYNYSSENFLTALLKASVTVTILAIGYFIYWSKKKNEFYVYL